MTSALQVLLFALCERHPILGFILFHRLSTFDATTSSLLYSKYRSIDIVKLGGIGSVQLSQFILSFCFVSSVSSILLTVSVFGSSPPSFQIASLLIVILERLFAFSHELTLEHPLPIIPERIEIPIAEIVEEKEAVPHERRVARRRRDRKDELLVCSIFVFF